MYNFFDVICHTYIWWTIIITCQIFLRCTAMFVWIGQFSFFDFKILIWWLCIIINNNNNYIFIYEMYSKIKVKSRESKIFIAKAVKIFNLSNFKCQVFKKKKKMFNKTSFLEKWYMMINNNNKKVTLYSSTVN